MLKTGGTLHTPVKSTRHVQKERLVRAGIGRIFGNTSFFGGKSAIKNRKNEIMDDILDIVKRGDRGASSSADDKKAMMEMLGIVGGPCRLPLRGLTLAEKDLLRGRLSEIGYFDWCGIDVGAAS